MFELHYLFKDSTNFEVLIIPIVWSAKEELGLGEIKQLAQAHIAVGHVWIWMLLCLTSEEEEVLY